MRFGMGMCLGMVMCMTMCMSAVAGVGTGLWLKGRIDRVHDQVHGAQHLSQHMVGLDLQIVRAQLDRHVPVAQVVGRTGQVKGRAMRRAGGDPQHRLGGCLHADQRAVFGDQHIAATHHRATRQKNAQAATQ